MGAQFRTRIGGRIGWVSFPWPYGRLTVQTHELEIKAMILGTDRFVPSDVISLEEKGWGGVRIRHAKVDYPSDVVVARPGRSRKLLEAIRNAGFDARFSGETPAHRSGQPFRWSFLLLFVGFWNGTLLAAMQFKPPDLHLVAGAITLLPTFLMTMAIQRSDVIEQMALKPGRRATEARPILRLFSVATGMGCLGFLLVGLLA